MQQGQSSAKGHSSALLTKSTEARSTEQNSAVHEDLRQEGVFEFELGDEYDQEDAESKGVASCNGHPDSLADKEFPPESAYGSPFDHNPTIPTPQFNGEVHPRDQVTVMYQRAHKAMIDVRTERIRKTHGKLVTPMQRRQYRLYKIRRDLLLFQLQDYKTREQRVTGESLINLDALSNPSDSGPGTPLEFQWSEDGEWSEGEINERLGNLDLGDEENSEED